MNQTIEFCGHKLLLCFSMGSVMRFQCGASFLMPGLKEQITSVTLCFWVGTTNSETCDMPKVGISDQTASPVSGKVPPLQVRRKEGKSNRATKICSGTFFDCEDIARHEFVPPNQTVDQKCFREVLQRLREHVCLNVHYDGSTRTGWFILTILRRTLFWQLVCMLADLAPYDLFSSPKLQLQLRRYRFKNMLTVLHAVPKSQL